MNKVMEIIDKINITQKILILLLVLNMFAGESIINNLPGFNNWEENQIWLGISISCIVGIVLFKNKKLDN